MRQRRSPSFWIFTYLGRPLPRDFTIATIFGWFFVVAGLYFLLARLRYRVSLIGCVAAGAVASTTWVPAYIGLRTTLPAEFLARNKLKPLTGTIFDELTKLWSMPGSSISIAICLASGFVMGWVLWWIGVRPLPEPVPKVSADVFD